MPLLIFITGKQGSGKSHVARAWAKAHDAAHLDIDRVLVAGGMKIPGSDGRDRTDWDLWHNISNELRESCIRSGLKEAYGDLVANSRDLVVEGAILCNPWFFDPMLAVLNEQLSKESKVHRCYLNVSNEIILRNVHKRADDNPKHRRHEREQFRTELDIAQTHLGFDVAVKSIPDRWIEFDSSDALELALNSVSE